MRSVDTIVSSNSLLDKMSVHLNGLLRQDEEPQVDKAVMLLDSMFAHADRAMSSDNDKQVLSILKRQVSSFIGVTLGVKPFLEQHEQQQQEEEEESDDDDDGKPNKLSWSAANEKESKSAWHEKQAYYEERNDDIYSPEHIEHERLRRQQLEEEQYGQDAGSGEEENDGSDEDDSDEYEEIVEQVQIKSREIGGAGGFQTVRRRQKKKKTQTTITTNFSYSHSSNSYDNNSAQYNNNSSNNRPYYPRHRVRVTEFRPEYLKCLPTETFCMPVFFPSEESYGVFHSALSSAKETLYVCVFSLTDNETADVLIDAKKRGIDVKVITDNDQMDERKGADVLRLHEQFHIPFKKDNR